MVFLQLKISISVTYDKRVLRIAATLSAKLFIPFPGSMTHLPLLCQINKEVSGVTGDEKCVLGTRMGLSCNRTKKVIHLIPSLPDIFAIL